MSVTLIVIRNFVCLCYFIFLVVLVYFTKIAVYAIKQFFLISKKKKKKKKALHLLPHHYPMGQALSRFVGGRALQAK